MPTIMHRLNALLKRVDPRARNPWHSFHSLEYQRHNARRLEHLVSLHLPLTNTTVLEVGAGIGDHTHFYLDRGNTVVSSDGRAKNVTILRARYPQITVHHLDMNSPPDLPLGEFAVIHCYGLLYHLDNPAKALDFLRHHCSGILLLETCVSPGDGLNVNLRREIRSDPTQATSGTGCRPTRGWIFDQLQRRFEHVYMPATQPHHPEFPTDWTQPSSLGVSLQRAIFIASRHELRNERLLNHIPDHQTR